jgi:hypothetical protein
MLVVLRWLIFFALGLSSLGFKDLVIFAHCALVRVFFTSGIVRFNKSAEENSSSAEYAS